VLLYAYTNFVCDLSAGMCAQFHKNILTWNNTVNWTVGIIILCCGDHAMPTGFFYHLHDLEDPATVWYTPKWQPDVPVCADFFSGCPDWGPSLI